MQPKSPAIFAFEPDARALPLLRENVGSSPNISIVPCAVGAEEGHGRFVLEQCSEVSHLSLGAAEGDNAVAVSVVSVDAFVRVRDLDVEAIKIDVEGGDREVIKGALKVLAEQRPLVLTESDPDEAMFGLLRPLDYGVYAYVRSARTREKRFARLTAMGWCKGDTKMLFLVPNSIAGELEAHAEYRGQG
jgi:FkbM family methyltransferase